MIFSEIQKRKIRESFEEIQTIAAPLAHLFYGRLFVMDPSAKHLFKNDIRSQGAKLMEMLGAVVNALDRFDTLLPVLRELGHRHSVYGVRDEQYAIVASALLWALGQGLEAQFDAETKAAWSALLNAVSSEMMAGAAEPVQKA